MALSTASRLAQSIEGLPGNAEVTVQASDIRDLIGCGAAYSSRKVTNLEDFANNQLVRPYWPMLPNENGEGGPSPIRKTMSLDEVLGLLTAHEEFRKAAIRRVSAMKVWFPSYIQHPLVDQVRGWMKES